LTFSSNCSFESPLLSRIFSSKNLSGALRFVRCEWNYRYRTWRGLQEQTGRCGQREEAALLPSGSMPKIISASETKPISTTRRAQ
jgi:hypothetical protein